MKISHGFIKWVAWNSYATPQEVIAVFRDCAYVAQHGLPFQEEYADYEFSRLPNILLARCYAPALARIAQRQREGGAS